MNLSDLRGKKITVMGLGLHGGGVGTVRFLYEAGAKVIVTDIKSREELAPSIDKLKNYKEIKYVFNQHRPEDFTEVDMVIKNPAASWSNKYVQLAMEKGIPVEIDSGLFFKLCKNTIIGITGTKGKTTVSSLICEILKAGGKAVTKVGIGQVSVLDKLKDIKNDSIVVFELSSWRASALGRTKLSPHVAVLTNIFPDHLNYYKNMDSYVADKKNIFSNQANDAFCVLNMDDENLNKMESEIKSQLIKVSQKKIENGRGVYIDNDIIYLNDGVDEKRIASISELSIRGKHNISNILLGIGAAWASGVAIQDIRRAIISFKGVAHRLEFVRELAGVKYFNDTAATMPEAAIAGINSFLEPIVLICGGADKNLDMKELAVQIISKVKKVIFLGGTGTEKLISCMRDNLEKAGLKKDFVAIDSMGEAVKMAREAADQGDVVLLSPGAASFGIFDNEFDRGDKFKASVNELE